MQPATSRLPESFYGLLEAIRARPGMYIGWKSLSHLYFWLDGWQFGRSCCGVAPSAEEEEFREFDAFVCKKYRWHDSGGWWRKIAYHHFDDATAFDEFFRLLDEFRASRRGTG